MLFVSRTGSIGIRAYCRIVPDSDGNPLVSLHDIVNRRTASGAILGSEERLTLQEAIRAYTYGSAYAMGQEQDKGTLTVGQLADFVALFEDLFAIPKENIRNVTVDEAVTAPAALATST